MNHSTAVAAIAMSGSATWLRVAQPFEFTSTPEENAAIVHGSIAYFGTYTVAGTRNAIHLHYDGSTYPE